MEETVGQRQHRHAQQWLVQTVARMVAETESAADTARPWFAGDPYPTIRPEPGPALRETRRLARLAEAEARRLAREARGAGASWEELAQLVGLEDAAVAFDWAAGPPYSASAHAVSWTCACCAGQVADYGPYSGEREEGHTADCARAARERAAHAAGWAEDE